eukprot:jgi/Bigna1/76114/fgenesh1_pg.39_\
MTFTPSKAEGNTVRTYSSRRRNKRTSAATKRVRRCSDGDSSNDSFGEIREHETKVRTLIDKWRLCCVNAAYVELLMNPGDFGHESGRCSVRTKNMSARKKLRHKPPSLNECDEDWTAVIQGTAASNEERRHAFHSQLTTPPAGASVVKSVRELCAEDIVNDDVLFYLIDDDEDGENSRPNDGGRRRKKARSKKVRKTAQFSADEEGSIPNKRIVFKPTSIQQMRRTNLEQKSMTQLLFDLLSGVTSKSLEGVSALHCKASTYSKPSRRYKNSLGDMKRAVPKVDKRAFKAVSLGKIPTEVGGQKRGRFLAKATKQLSMTLNHLLAVSADPNKRNEDGLSALYLAIHYRNGENLLRDMLEKGAKSNVRVFGKSLLERSMTLGSSGCAKLLLENGALPQQEASAGHSLPRLVDFAATYDFLPQAQEKLRKKLLDLSTAGNESDYKSELRVILSHIDSVEFSDDEGFSPLFRAVKSGRIVVLIMCIEWVACCEVPRHGYYARKKIAARNRESDTACSLSAVFWRQSPLSMCTRPCVSFSDERGVDDVTVNGRIDDGEDTVKDFAQEVIPNSIIVHLLE